MLFGEMGQTLLLGGRRVGNSVASSLNYPYQFSTLGEALNFELGAKQRREVQ